jgi:hypothetical protein
MSASRRSGRISLMGFVQQSVRPWSPVGKTITIRGKLKYERDDTLQLIKMVERSLLHRGSALVDTKTHRDCRITFRWRAGRLGLMPRLSIRNRKAGSLRTVESSK